jgi:hypothetical protein
MGAISGESAEPQGRASPKMRTIAYNQDAESWSSGSHLMGTKSFASNDNNDNNFSGIICRARFEILMMNQATLCRGLLNNYANLSSSAPILLLFKRKAHVLP